MYNWDGYESNSDSITIDTSSTTSTTLLDLRVALIQPLGESINSDIENNTKRIEDKFDALNDKIDEMIKYLAISQSKIFTGKDTPDEAVDNNVIDGVSKIFTGKDTPDEAVDNNVIDGVSKIITGVKIDDLVLTGNGGESGEYNDSLNARLQKTTELISGMMVGLFTEDEIKDKLQSTDINNLSSIEENLGIINEGASFMKNYLRRNSNFSLDDGNTHNPSSPLGEIERSIKALVLSFVHADLKGDLKMAELKREAFPSNIPHAFWDDLKHAYAKTAGDFTRTINEFDPNDLDNHKYGNLNITDND